LKLSKRNVARECHLVCRISDYYYNYYVSHSELYNKSFNHISWMNLSWLIRTKYANLRLKTTCDSFRNPDSVDRMTRHHHNGKPDFTWMGLNFLFQWSKISDINKIRKTLKANQIAAVKMVELRNRNLAHGKIGYWNLRTPRWIICRNSGGPPSGEQNMVTGTLNFY